MSLSLYNKKRNFSETSEPKGKESSSAVALRFVIQKHDASRLHYDFRLEMTGVLKSWAVPKGLSLNPADKRLAMMVEDHPYEYRNFEGIIPEGNYGAGTVIVWDEGTYRPDSLPGLSKEEQEKELLQGLAAGNLKIIMEGKKIRGASNLRKLRKEGDEKSWLLIKIKDDFSGEADVTKFDQSVKSGKTIAGVAEAAGAAVNHPEEVKEAKEALPGLQPSATAKGAKKQVPEKEPEKIKRTASLLSLDGGRDQAIMLDQHQLSLTNLNKIYWKKEGTLKMDVVNYYLRMAPYLLPYMLQRPQSLHRYPNGTSGPGFFQKDVAGKVPDWIQTHADFSESTGEDVQYLVCSNKATLIYMANLGCIEMHPWHSRVSSWQQPDWCLIDLDPQGIGFDKVIDCAQVVKKVLHSAGTEGYVKTSGSTGIHIYIPLGALYNYEQSKQLAERIVTLVHQEIPSYTSLERNPEKRKRKIYLDFLQNRETQTAAAPYSLRPKPGMPVSTPLHWDEVKKGLTPATYNMTNIFDRLKTEGDLFKPVLAKGIDLEKVLQRLQSLVS